MDIKRVILDILLKKVRYIMKKFIISMVVVGATVFTGCSSEHAIKNIRSYKISFTPNEELSQAKCFNSKGILMINETYIVGELQNDKVPASYIDGRYSQNTQEITMNIFNGNNELIALAGGVLNSKDGSGSWTGVNCYGKWVAQRDD